MSADVANSEVELEELQRVVDSMELQYNQMVKPISLPKEGICFSVAVDDIKYGVL